MSCVIASVTIDNKRELNYMRVVAGEYGGRRLKAVRNEDPSYDG